MTDLPRALARLARTPALHFLAAGSLLFLANSWWQGWNDGQTQTSARETIVISAEQIDQISQEFLEQHRVAPTPQQLPAAVDDAIDEEVLFREARAIGLHRENTAVRKRLVQIARFVSPEPNQDEEGLYQAALELQLDRNDTVVRRHLAMLMRLAAANAPIAGETPPDDAELEAYLQRHPERFMQPRRVRLSHVYLSEDRRGEAAKDDANRLLDELRAGAVGPDEAARLGDPFLLGHHFAWQTRQGLQKALGGDFAETAVRIEPRVWSGPVRSGFGWHLVWVEDVRPATTPALAAVHDRVLRAVLEERREWRVQETLKVLRANYTIEAERPQASVADATPAGKNG